jgi:hypothetical protein
MVNNNQQLAHGRSYGHQLGFSYRDQAIGVNLS